MNGHMIGFPHASILAWSHRDTEKTLVLDLNHKRHYFSNETRILNDNLYRKYQLFDLYNLCYLRLECWDHFDEENKVLDAESVISKIKNKIDEINQSVEP